MIAADAPRDVEGEVVRIRAALARSIDVLRLSPATPTWRVVQRCPICAIELGFVFSRASEEVPGDWLHRHLFAIYDEHHCHHNLALADAATLDELYARAERESVRAAARAIEIRERERGDPAPTLPCLYERAERESLRMAELAMALSKRVARAP